MTHDDDDKTRLGRLTPERYRRASDLAARFRRLPTEQRAREIAAACSDDPALRPYVEALACDDGPSDITKSARRAIAETAADLVHGDVASRPLAQPVSVGPYRILQVLGEGGMGTVYEAERSETIQRRVALKVIKLGMDTREVVARFEAERQALSVMDHPAIARVLDGGATEDGRPYFVMELVRGVPLTSYCNRNALPLRQRIELFVELCHAVQHAHHKGVIHRDLKPSNVLVVEQDGKPTPKVIDFGIAKAIGLRLGDASLVTGLGQAIGTPAYMSPEQAEGSRLDVDTRTDVYSLGVILYELLVGTLPVDWEKEDPRTYLDRLARHETQTPTPSARLTGLGAKQAEVARERRTNAASLRRELKGDLDWVVMMALDPDRARRYDTVNGLAMDLQRYLAGEPVLARGPSLPYAVSRFVRRHRASVAAAVAVTLALLLGISGTTYGLVTAREARARAEREATTATRALDFLVGMFEEADPMADLGESGPLATSGPPRGETLTAKEILGRGVERLETELQEEPIARVRLLSALGNVHRSLGLFEQAEPLLQEALELRRRELGPEHVDVARDLMALSDLLYGQGRYEKARQVVEEALAIEQETLGPDHAEVASSLVQLSSLLMELGDLAGARSRGEEALAIHRAAPGPPSHDMANVLYNLGTVLLAQGDNAGARSRLEESLEIARKADGPEHLYLTLPLGSLSMLLRKEGDLPGARAHAERVLEIRRKALGPSHPRVGTALNNLAYVVHEQGDLAGARALFEQALDLQHEALGTEHPVLASTLGNLAMVLEDQGDLAAARSRLEEALEILRKGFPPEHMRVGVCLNNLARVLTAQRDFAGARSLLEPSLAIYRKALGPEHANVALVLGNLAAAVEAQGDHARSRSLFEEALGIQRKALPSQHPNLAGTLCGLGRIVRDQGELDQAETLLREALTIREKSQRWGPAHAKTVQTREDLAETLRRAGRRDEADALVAGLPPEGSADADKPPR